MLNRKIIINLRIFYFIKNPPTVRFKAAYVCNILNVNSSRYSFKLRMIFCNKINVNLCKFQVTKHFVHGLEFLQKTTEEYYTTIDRVAYLPIIS